VRAITKESSSLLKPYDHVHGRHFDFRDFEFLGTEFVSAFGIAFVKFSSTVALETAQSYFSAMVKFFRWVNENQQQLDELVFALRENYRESRPRDWENAVALWRNNVIGKEGMQNSGKYNLIRAVNALLRRLFALGALPKFFLVGAPSDLRPTRPTKTLAEIVPKNSEIAAEIVDKALSKGTENGIELQVKRDFLMTLVNETGKILGTPEEHAKELMRINADRLGAIRRSAETDFKKWVGHWNEGQSALEACDKSYEEIAALIYHKTSRGNYSFDMFPREDPQTSLSRLLTFVAGKPEYRGRIVGHGKGTFCQRLSHQLTRFGSPAIVQAYLFPHIELTVAVITLILCDTGANVSVARTLLTRCMQNSENAGHKIIMGNKMRAGGKLIVDELPTRDRFHEISSVHAIEIYQAISESLRKLASKKHSELLFLCLGPNTGEVRGVSSLTWTRGFSLFRKRHPEISHLPISSNMIRPSVLMQADFDKETGIIAAAAIGDQASLRTTNGYVARYPNKLVWVRLIREFQALFHAVSIHSIKGAAEKLGLTARQVRTLFSEACRTGLGVACLNPKSGIQAGSEKGKTCTQVQNCHRCSNSLVIATVENLRDLIIWNHHLEEKRREWELTRPEKWAKDWLPWLVFTRVVIEQASRGRTAAQFRRANTIANTMILNGGINLPLLW